MEEDRGELAELVIELRKRQRMSQKTLAYEVGLSSGAIGQLERGYGSMGIESVLRIGQVLEAAPDEMLRLEQAWEQEADRRTGRGRPRSPRLELLEARIDSLTQRVEALEARPSPPAEDLKARANPDEPETGSATGGTR